MTSGMMNAKMAYDLLSGATGSFAGRGVNHEGQPFLGELTLETCVAEKVIAVHSSATGDNGDVYHSEVSWIGFDITGSLMLYVASSNHPGITPHAFNRIEETAGEKRVVFRFGDPADRAAFREEVTFALSNDGAISHHYAWGLPHGEFEPRSGSKMARLQANS